MRPYKPALNGGFSAVKQQVKAVVWQFGSSYSKCTTGPRRSEREIIMRAIDENVTTVNVMVGECGPYRAHFAAVPAADHDGPRFTRDVVARIVDDTAATHACNSLPGECLWLEWADGGRAVTILTDVDTPDGDTGTHVIATVAADGDGLFPLGKHIPDDWQYAADA